ncbi:MAG: DUF6186 family protein [Actinobacteria bacterium]|nr:DUF6186 family protein [Actinomycetota bacterium]
MSFVPIVIYLLAIVTALCLVIIGRLRPDLIAPLGAMFGRVLRNRAARVMLIVFWWWLGWHFLAGVTLDTLA